MPDYLKIYMLAGIGTTLLCLLSWLMISRANLKAEIAQLRSDYSLCESANADWALKAKAYQQAMQQLKDDELERNNKVKEILEKAQKAAEQHIRLAKKIMARKGRNCEDAQKLVILYMGRKE